MKSYKDRTASVIEKSGQMRKRSAARKRILAGSAAGVLCLTLVLAVPLFNSEPAADEESPSGVYFAQDYDDVYAALQTWDSGIMTYIDKESAFSVEYGTSRTDANMALTKEDSVTSEAENLSAGQEIHYAADAAESEKDYSGTNNQVEGIDEGDIVKTDGKYIYALGNGKVKIFRADGENTELMSSFSAGINLDQTEINAAEDFAAKQEGTVRSAPYELYVDGDILAVVCGRYTQPYCRGEKELYAADCIYIEKSETEVEFYDISNKEKPEKISTAGQDGNTVSGRMTDGKLYLTTSYYVYEKAEKDEPETYVPCIYEDGRKSTVEAGSIAIIPERESNSYTVITVYDMETGRVMSSRSVLGAGDSIYMSGDNLYVLRGKTEEIESEPYEEDRYKAVDVNVESSTSILKFRLTEESVDLVGEASVPGYVDSQFSVDEKEGYLRVVSTKNDSDYRILTDEKYGFENYEWKEATSENGVYVLDENMKITGKLEGLAEGEQVYSARFDGDTGYFVTFRTVDPLFSVDLSNPANPEILGELKIPGFSEYLHKYGDGLLFGLGLSADEKNGQTGNMKLTMFDISNPADVTEKHTLETDNNWSEALYNHKAALISEKKNIIAFPAGEKYLIYGYDREKGFYQRGAVDTGDLGYDSRGLYIGNYAYIVSMQELRVLDMEKFEVIKTVTAE
ncbi:MAG: beta-propeller domain-containing protein [Bacillota bacterium]|nr:beta-propeller domain-containing protein [Bacillota bacterium]